MGIRKEIAEEKEEIETEREGFIVGRVNRGSDRWSICERRNGKSNRGIRTMDGGQRKGNQNSNRWGFYNENRKGRGKDRDR